MNRRNWLALTAVVIGFACAPSVEDDDIGRAGDAIRFGTSVTNPQGSAHVNIWLGPKTATGSGTLLSDRWVLTSGHVLDKSRCQYAGGVSGNAITDPCTFLPSTHLVGHGNYSVLGPPSEFIPADRISVHPRFTQANDGTSDTGVDVALIHASKPFTITGNPSFQYPTLSTSETSFLGSPVCLGEFGYGPSLTNLNLCDSLTDKLSAGTLMTAQVSGVTSSSSTDWFDTVAAAACGYPTAQTARGDSGGGVFLLNTLVGVHRAGPAACVAGPGEAVRASKFAKWAKLVMGSLADVNAIVNLDLVPDTIVLREDASGLNYEFVVLDGATDAETTYLSVPKSLVGSAVSVALSAGKFNNDSFGDAIFQINGLAFVLAGGSGAFTSQALVPSANGETYDRFYVADFDDDGYDDVEAVRSSGWVDVLYGSGSGLTPGRDTWQIPSDDRNDGWFYAVTGPNEVTWPQPSFQSVLHVSDPAAEVRVEIFDGRNGSGFDRYDLPSAPSCFRLYGYPIDDGSPPNPSLLIKEVQGDAVDPLSQNPVFPENEWGTLYKGANDAKGNISNTTNYQYLISVTHAACSGTNTPFGINSFKIRASPGSLYAPKDFSFHPRDLFNPLSPGGVNGGSYPSKFDTDYSGFFVPFVMNVTNVAKLTLTDTDADRVDDPNFPGKEEVANKLSYVLVDYADPIDAQNNLKALATDTQVSGNYFSTIGDLGTYDRTYCLDPPKPGDSCFAQLASHPTDLLWIWQDVVPTNIIRVSRSGSYVLMSSRPPPIPAVTTAQSVQAWVSGGQGGLASYLPILLGEENPCGDPVGSSVLVSNAYDALRILDGKAGPGYGGSVQVRKFRSALLGAKLNVVRGASLGETMTSAFIYGTDGTVGQALIRADKALARHCLGMSCDGAKGCPLGGPVIPPQQGANLTELAAAEVLIAAINANQLTYHP